MRSRSKEKIILDKLVAKDFLATEKRAIIIRNLCQYEEITDMVSIYSELRQKYGIGYATFYACLRILVQQKIIIRDASSVRKNVYTFNPSIFK